MPWQTRYSVRESVLEILRNDISAVGLKVGGVILLDSTQRALAIKYLERFDPTASAVKKRDVRGDKGPIEKAIRELVVELYGKMDEAELENWQSGIASIIRKALKQLSAEPSGDPRTDQGTFLVTHWFGWTEAELLLAIDMQAIRAREIAKAIIAAPNLPADTDVAALLYPPTLGNTADTNADAAYRMCRQMTYLAEQSVDRSSSHARGNAAVRAGAKSLLSKLDQRRRAGLPPSTRAEQFFYAFNPLQRPAGSARTPKR